MEEEQEDEEEQEGEEEREGEEEHEGEGEQGLMRRRVRVTRGEPENLPLVLETRAVYGIRENEGFFLVR